jgi:hypothetical protein
VRRIKVSLSIGFANATHRDVIEVEDDATEEDIDETIQQWASNYISIGWSEEGA